MLTELQGLSERWYQAWLEKDAATVECLMAEDYLYVGPNGLALDRQAILAIIGSPSYRLDHGTRTEVVVRALGHEAAIVRHRWQGAGSFEGTSFTDDNRCVLVWEKQAGVWRSDICLNDANDWFPPTPLTAPSTQLVVRKTITSF
jgi:uncharacterized protein (TIGR02246 family)